MDNQKSKTDTAARPLAVPPPLPGSECATCDGTGMQNLIGCPGAMGECEDCGGSGRKERTIPLGSELAKGEWDEIERLCNLGREDLAWFVRTRNTDGMSAQQAEDYVATFTPDMDAYRKHRDEKGTEWTARWAAKISQNSYF